MHFKDISAKIQLKNLKLFQYCFLAVRGNIRLGDSGTFSLLVTPLSLRDI